MAIDWDDTAHWGGNVTGCEHLVARKPFPADHPLVTESEFGSWLPEKRGTEE